MRSTLGIFFLLAAAMAYAGPAESHHDHLCSKHQPNPAVTCQRH
jgi:hypothetical protein